MLTDTDAAVDAGLQVGMQTSLFGAAELDFRSLRSRPVVLDPRSSIRFESGWLQGSDRVFEQLRAEMPWRAVERPMYDRVVEVPRLICTVDPSELDDDHPLARITAAVGAALGCGFGSVGLNYYRHGRDSVAWHADRIGATRRPTTVALVSLGSPRTLALRRRSAAPSEASGATRSTPTTRLSWRLGGGDLFVMSGACQHEWEHSVPKERGVGPRISLAFRSHHGGGGPQHVADAVPPLWASHKLQ